MSLHEKFRQEMGISYRQSRVWGGNGPPAPPIVTPLGKNNKKWKFRLDKVEVLVYSGKNTVIK